MDYGECYTKRIPEFGSAGGRLFLWIYDNYENTYKKPVEMQLRFDRKVHNFSYNSLMFLQVKYKIYKIDNNEFFKDYG